MTHPSLVGFNEPNSDRRARERAATFTPHNHVDRPPRKRKSTSYKASCVEVLINYRKYISNNDVQLHHRWKMAMDSWKLVLHKWPDDVTTPPTPSQKRIYHLYHYASMFREMLYYDFYDRGMRAVQNFKRGDSWWWTEDSYLYLMIEPNTFHLQISLKRSTDPAVF